MYNECLDKTINNNNKDLLLQTLDIIGKTAFGFEFNALHSDSELNQQFQKLLSGSGMK